MAMRTATAALHKRITAAAAHIGRGVRYNDKDMELEGRRLSSLAHIENQILLGREYLSTEDAKNLAKMLFSDSEPVDDFDPEDYTADAVETNAEALARTPRLDADGDYDDEAEDL